MDSRAFANALFAPRSIALIGASGDAAKNTSRPQRYLRKHGYGGRIIPINRDRGLVLGEPAYPDLAHAPGPIDHAFIMVPGKAVPDVIADCCRAHVPVATIYSNGFAEIGEEGCRRQQAVVDIARAGGVRLVGPNSMGIINTHGAMPMTVNAALELPQIKPGSLGVVSHSGSILGTLLSRGQARGIGFSKMVSIGNEADLSVGEIADLLVDDPETSAILLFLETLRDPDRLAAMARRAFSADKPVIAYKLGRSGAGQRLAASHSGALAGPDRTANAFFRHHGIIRVDMLETIFEIPALLCGHKPAKGRRVAVMTTTGGGAAMVVDRLGALGMDLVSPPDRVVARLEGMGIPAGKAPLTDLTMAGTSKEVYGAVLGDLLQSSECDAVVAVVGSSGQFHSDLAVEPIVAAPKTDKPLAVFIAPHAEKSLRLLGEAGIAAFRTPEGCADAVRAYLEWSPPTEEAPAPARDLAPVEAALAAAKGAALDGGEARAVFEALGIPQTPAHVIGDGQEASRIGYPVAAKVLSPDVPHKTEAGGVVLDIAGEKDLRAACRDILARVRKAHPKARISGILVERMERGLAEVLIGFKRDWDLGPAVMVGVGGTLAEIYGDFSVRMAPVGPAEAREMVAEVTGLAVIRGYRSLPKGDCEALARAICALSDLARVTGRTVLEAEINPLIIKVPGEGVVAVDGLVLCAE